MKKILILFLSIAVLTGCSSKKEEVTTTTSTSTSSTQSTIATTNKKTIERKLDEINNNITDLWNHVICEVSWYSKAGTSSTGETLDIEFVISTMDKYYNKVKDAKEYMDQLSDEYKDLKEAYNKLLDKATIIINELKKETPKANVKLSYQTEIELFQQYQDYFYDTVLDF